MKYLSFYLIAFVAFGLLGCDLASTPSQPPFALTLDFRSDPVGIDVPNPQFSWQLNDTTRGAKQTGYQLLVASSAEKLANNQGDVWDSDMQRSDVSVLIPFKGKKPLKSKTPYFWKVRIWDKNGQPTAYSQPAYFETGILEGFSEWQAQWIGRQNPDNLLASSLLRKKFEITKPVYEARAYITGLGNYVAYLNGEKIGKDLLTPGWTDYPTRVQYQTYNVTDLLKQGENALGAMLGNMWWSSGLGWKGAERYSEGPLRFLMRLDIYYQDGTTLVITSDDTWKTAASPVVEDHIYHGVKWDARLEPAGWKTPEYDDNQWANAVVFAHDGAQITAQKAPTIQVTEEITPLQRTEVKPGIFVFDMGVNMVGWVRMAAQGESGTEITLRFAELLHEDGTVAQENLRSARATDVFVLKGEGKEVFEPVFTYHGFRYVQIEGYPGTPEPADCIGVVFHSNAPKTGAFACSNDLLNKIQRNIERGQRGNMHSVPTDCPQRDERLGWMGDAQIFAPTSSYNMQMMRFFDKWMTDIVDSQDESGFVHDVNPAIVVKGPSKPGWGDAVVVVPWVLHRFYGDKQVLARYYDGMAKWVAYMEEKSVNNLYTWANEDSTWFGYGDWIAYEKTSSEPIGAAYLSYCNRLMSEIASALGKNEAAKSYARRAEETAEAYHQKWFEPEKGSYFEGTQTANLLPLAFGIVPQALRQQVADKVAEDVLAKGKHPSTGFLGTGYLLPILSEYGHHQLAYETVSQTSYPSWGYMVENGATSMWELWNSDTEKPEGMNSRNHFALGSIGEWFYSHLAGIRPDPEQPGFKNIIIKPEPAEGLTYVMANYETPYGAVAIRWEKTGEGLAINLTLPANTTADLFFPIDDPKAFQLFEGSNLLADQSGAKGATAQYLEYLGIKEGKICIKASAGKYQFTIMPGKNLTGNFPKSF